MARLDDGHSTTVTFADTPTVKFWEKEVTPPGMDAGGPIDTTTMLNTLYRTFAPKSLITMTPLTETAAYSVGVFSDILNSIKLNQLITVTFPDSSTVAFWGFVDKFTPNALVEGEQPTAEVVIQPTNQNAAGVETAPVVIAA